MSSRTWIKVYCDRWLDGSISDEPIHIRGVWVTLLALAGNGKYGDSGTIKALDGVGFNNNQMAAMIKVPLNLWVAAKNRLEKTGRVSISKGNIITIVNWKKYQSEYERTSKYRSKDTAKTTTNDTAIEDRVESIDNRIVCADKPPRTSNNPYIKQLQEYLHFPINGKPDPVPNPPKEAKFIKKMLDRGFNWEDIFRCWKNKVDSRNEYVSMAYVNEDIAKNNPAAKGKTLPDTKTLKEAWK